MEDGELEISISFFFSRWEIHRTQYAWVFSASFFVSVEGDVNDVISKDCFVGACAGKTRRQHHWKRCRKRR